MEDDIESNLYYIYIDTKILGAVIQLLSYFQSNVFNSDACITVYVKYYKENSEIISQIFDNNNIPYNFIKRYIFYFSIYINNFYSINVKLNSSR